ncbi:4-hydroxybenzoate polyprenyltransferase [Synechococcus sp. MU1648]|uniref:4-hydroxybenzoate polyprenyltransferase n=1 Tax=unclassified Synechococcus TaxID=2626047 RepID=UPI001CF82E2C|nr:4-hydroxybenzoate polyprenyltransferase [Synechococcus sp. MU1650]MCB4411835.1 4-hydroxybenzoate polyprenyltransferase [Synechococcus sp. MU1611]
MISSSARLQPWIELLRWNKPTGRLILLIPAGWALWLNPTAPPGLGLILQILVGGLAVSGAGCIANDLWDQRFDGKVERTKSRPLARGALQRGPAFALLLTLLVVSLAVVLSLPAASLRLCLALACTAVLPILGYPSAKRWFAFPQVILALCWGFAVLIPWAAATASLSWSPVLVCSWLATVVWTFGFDTVYAMADRRDDASLGLHSSALSLGFRVVPVVRGCYLVTAITLAIAAWSAQIPAPFWPLWLLATVFMQLSCNPLNKQDASMGTYGKHFSQQVQAGILLWLGLVLARGWGV